MTTAAPAMLPALRPLKWNERVRRGDYVADGHDAFKLWDGPAGFRADSFIKTIYRQIRHQPAAGKT